LNFPHPRRIVGLCNPSSIKNPQSKIETVHPHACGENAHASRQLGCPALPTTSHSRKTRRSRRSSPEWAVDRGTCPRTRRIECSPPHSARRASRTAKKRTTRRATAPTGWADTACTPCGQGMQYWHCRQNRVPTRARTASISWRSRGVSAQDR
jgi:hypothetical protein